MNIMSEMEVRIVPYVVSKEVNRNGREVTIQVNNLTKEEIKNMSCESRMLWLEDDKLYITNPPIIYNGDGGVRDSFCYIYDELTSAEKEKYFSRSTLITATISLEKGTTHLSSVSKVRKKNA